MTDGHEPPGSDAAADGNDGGRGGSAGLGEDRQVGWHADPFGRFEQRWWDGLSWTEKTRSADMGAIDPPGIDVAPSTISTSAAEPARPIEDAVLPIPKPRIADKLALLLGFLVFLGLIAVLVVALTV